MTGTTDKATAVARDLVDRGAPWKAGAAWWLVLAEGIVAAVLGLVLLVTPSTSANLVLSLLGLGLLILAAMSVWQIARGRIAPDRVALAAFRSGSGVTTGLLVLVATLVIGYSEAVTAALAVVLGIGFVIFSVTGLVGLVVGREPGESLPIARLLIFGAAAVVGLLLAWNGANGYDHVKGTFTLLGIVLILAGVGLGGYGYLMRERQTSEAES